MIVTCFIKYYLICLLQVSLTYIRTQFSTIYPQNHASFLFGFLLYGNIIDNIRSPKYFSCATLAILGVLWLFTGGYLKMSITFYKTHTLDENKSNQPLLLLSNLANIFSAGVILISIVQIYNWTSLGHISTILAIFFSAEVLGYLTPVPLL